MFKICRHGGRSTDEWRTLLETEDQVKADEKFAKVAGKLRQGRVILVKVEGDKETVIKGEWAPVGGYTRRSKVW